MTRVRRHRAFSSPNWEAVAHCRVDSLQGCRVVTRPFSWLVAGWFILQALLIGVAGSAVKGLAADPVRQEDAPASRLPEAAPTGSEHGELVRRQDTHFQTFNLYIDSEGDSLAAYQVLVRSASHNALLVGLEGGTPAAFSVPPYYDPRALLNETVAVAAYSVASELPHGRSLVARLHVQVTGDREPEWIVTAQTAADPNGRKITVRASVEPTSTEKE